MGRLCPRCGGTIRDADDRCSLCFMPIADRGEITEDLAKAFDDREYYRWEPDEHLTGPAPAPVLSRWHAGPLSFGPSVKLIATLVIASVLLLPGLGSLLYSLAVYVMADPYKDDLRPFGMFMFVGIVFSAAGAYLLGEVWRRERIR